MGEGSSHELTEQVETWPEISDPQLSVERDTKIRCNKVQQRFKVQSFKAHLIYDDRQICPSKQS